MTHNSALVTKEYSVRGKAKMALILAAQKSLYPFINVMLTEHSQKYMSAISLVVASWQTKLKYLKQVCLNSQCRLSNPLEIL